MKNSPTLSLNLGLGGNKPSESSARPPPHSASPRSPPSTNLLFSHEDQDARKFHPNNGPTANSQNHLLPKSPTSPRHKKESSRSLFSKNKTLKYAHNASSTENASTKKVLDVQSDRSMQVYPYRQSPRSTPDLGTLRDDEISSGGTSQAEGTDQFNDKASIKSNTIPYGNGDVSASKKLVNKHRFPKLTRSRSIRNDDSSLDKMKPKTPVRTKSREHGNERTDKFGKQPSDTTALKTAPIEKDRSFREMMSSTIRNHSADRHDRHHTVADSEEDSLAPPKERRDPFSSLSTSFKESSVLSNIRQSSTKAADGIGKASKGFLGKWRNGYHDHRDPPLDVENYVPKVIVLPLVEQTRVTRISKRLEASKDKTEFWMPALPWRCIDYLNMKGCEEEGLYRVPGSGRDIKHWQIRFDKELDIDLFDQQDLYDINTIGSMFKAWLRELPDEIFPKSTQARIAEQCKGATSTPQMLKDELSKLPPFNYYLLFAITCHISLLHSCSEMNKMDYRNLCICFQPCMKIEAFCFQWLVLDWRNCWQGCWTEKEYLAEELRVMNIPQASSTSSGRGLSPHIQSEQRTISSSSSSKLSSADSAAPERMRLPPLSSTPTEESDKNATPTQPGPSSLAPELPALTPMKPLSPIGLLQ